MSSKKIQKKSKKNNEEHTEEKLYIITVNVLCYYVHENPKINGEVDLDSSYMRVLGFTNSLKEACAYAKKKAKKCLKKCLKDDLDFELRKKKREYSRSGDSCLYEYIVGIFDSEPKKITTYEIHKTYKL
jgi:hypothetical protein